MENVQKQVRDGTNTQEELKLAEKNRDLAYDEAEDARDKALAAELRYLH